MATWRSAFTGFRKVVVAGAALAAMAVGASVAFSLSSCDFAEAEERIGDPIETPAPQYDDPDRYWDERDRARAERWERLEAEAEARVQTMEEEAAKAPPPKRRRVRRFQWESPADARGRIWNVPDEESDEALLTALLRVCIAEADGRPQDCVGIWQTVSNIRRRTCDRDTPHLQRITECDEDGETMLSALRRSQRHALGMIKAHNRRAAWVRNLTTDCTRPEGYPHSEDRWNSHYGTKVCPQTVADARRLIAGELPESRPGARVRWLPGRPITWGGRCESGKASCDDRIACARGLARIQNAGTLNAFWCRPGRRGCPDDIDPVCIEMGFPSLQGPAETQLTVTAIAPEGDEGENS